MARLLDSPFFNRRPAVTRLYHFLEERLFELGLRPTKQEMSAYLFPEEPYDAQRIRQLMSYLLQQIEHFLALEQLQAEPLDTWLALAAMYRKLGLAKHFQQTLRKAAAQLERQPYRQALYFEIQYRLGWEAYQFTSREQRFGEQHLQATADHLDLRFVLQKLRQSCLLLAHRAVNPTEYDWGLLPTVLQLVEKQGLDREPAVAVYYYAYQTLAHPDAATHFPHFQRALLAHAALFPEEERRDLFLLAINHCIRSLNAGQEQYAAAGLKLYRAALERGDLLTNGVLSRFAYRNIVAMGLKEKDFIRTEQFIHQYYPYLEPAHRESMYSFSLARLAYFRGRHGQAMQALQKADYDDPLLNLAAKTLLLKIYYETEEHELLASHLAAMQNFLRRNRKLGYHRNNYRNIVRLTRMLLKTNPFDRKEKEQLEREISAEAVLTERDWLLEQVKKL